MSKESQELIDRYRNALQPQAPAIDQQAIWFEAGRAAERAKRRGGWQRVYSGTMTALAASLAFVLVSNQPTEVPQSEQGEPTTQVVGVDETPTTPPTNVAGSPSSPSEPVEASDEVPDLWRAWFPTPQVDPNSYFARRDRAMAGDLTAFSRSLSRVEYQQDESFDDEPYIPSSPATQRELLEEYLPKDDRRPVARPPVEPNSQSNLSPEKELA